MTHPRPTLEYCRELFLYDPESGLLTYRRNHHRFKAGSEVGQACRGRGTGHRRVRIKFRSYAVTHIIWLMMTGAWPEETIDHIDRNPRNNSWNNLREATQSQQRGNLGLRATNKSGARGVYQSSKGRWSARITLSQNHKHLGSFKTKEEAIAAYDKAARERWGEFYTPTHALTEPQHGTQEPARDV